MFAVETSAIIIILLCIEKWSLLNALVDNCYLLIN